MSSHQPLIFLLAAASLTSSFATARPWKNSDGTRTVHGELIKSDATSITIRNTAEKEVTIQRSMLHADDLKWLDNHANPALIPQDPKAFFDNLTFKDTRETTLKKLKASKIVELTTNEVFIGRSGLNGIFRTRNKIGSLEAFLYFDWSETGKLKELNVQTKPRPDTAYKTELEPSWLKFIELLSTLYGQPVQKGPIPAQNTLADGAFFPSHFWNLETGGSAILGTAREGKAYQVVVRFTEKKPQVIEIP